MKILGGVARKSRSIIGKIVISCKTPLNSFLTLYFSAHILAYKSFLSRHYLYEIGKEAAHDDYAILLAEIGGGKGKVTRHYILEGVKLILGKIRVEEVFKRHAITPKIQENIKNTLGA